MVSKHTSGDDKLPIPYLALALGVTVFIFAALGGWRYSGLLNRLGEWQFSKIGIYFNLASILLFVALLALIWRIGRLLVKRSRSGDKKTEDSETEELYQNLLQTTLAKKITGWLSLSIICFAFVTLIYLLLLPSEEMRTREVTAAQAARGPEGPVVLSGLRAAGPTARYRQGFLFWQYTYYFMPVAKENDQNGAAIATVFLEVPAKLAQSNSPIRAKGILRHAALPDEVASMYSDANFQVAADASVIFANESSSNWTTLVLLLDILLLGFLSLSFHWFLRRREKRLKRKAESMIASQQP